jgi:thioredoxin 1
METFNDVISGNQLVLVDFFATWCQPCKMMYPVLEDLKKTVGDKLRIIKVDVDAHNDVAAQYGIRSVPCHQWIYSSNPRHWLLLRR